MTPDRDDRAGGDLSIARLALATMGTAATVLVVVALVVVLVQPGPVVGLGIALVGVVGAIAGMGVVSKRMTNRAYGDRRRRPDQPGGDPKPGRDR
ncbi:hypothetical protein GS894_11935 [Rhodococcus hoagii]|uniref:Uncharacterized protein n=3 Tax=Rhodococcus hoagii TaxID=43767 RepID=F1TJ77_RHOHA|nr:hypothetical protein C7H75_14165 [Prescottella equi]EGD24414.1 hypothetical protein HMPREF0724_11950 [Prescottella equi ATCC 33707]ERN45440.1 hypothetical protein H849_13727 [Prescottella equi NBRC 101255 = C 7]MBM4471592.1 hypothetical protein [Prescottella equi]MBM4488818.1 hypothetical protein [Prescottella equi]